MLQLNNKTPFEAALTVFPDVKGVDTLYVVIKASFELGKKLAISNKQLPPAPMDTYWGEPGKSSLKLASDMHLGKHTTDVVLTGRAWTPANHPVESLDVGLAVGERKKAVRVFGDRVWKRGMIGLSATLPEPFESMPLVYERSYGGTHVADEAHQKIFAEERNPVGCGFKGKRKSNSFVGELLPNIEDPRRLLTKPENKATPTGFGFIAPSWMPRRSFAGTYDKAWQEQRAPFLPHDFDIRFFNTAHPDLVFDRFLQGGEPVKVIGACRNGPLSFKIPCCSFAAHVKIAGRGETPSLALETVHIEPEEERLCLVWRGAVPCDKKALKVEEVRMTLEKMKLE